MGAANPTTPAAVAARPEATELVLRST